MPGNNSPEYNFQSPYNPNFNHVIDGKAHTRSLRGFNIFSNIMPVKDNSMYQMIFFSRPKMHLDYFNMLLDRKMASLLTDVDGIETYIRLMLDPMLHSVSYVKRNGNTEKTYLKSGLINRHNPFIPILSNNLMSLSPPPDLAMNMWNMKPGMREETWGYVDSPPTIYKNFQLNAQFNPESSGALKRMLDTWVRYPALNRLDYMLPRQNELVGGRVDYNTAIYIFNLAPNKRKIMSWGRTIANPIVFPTGGQFAYNHEKTIQATPIDTVFNCYGFEYNDPIILKEFNDLCGVFNPELRKKEIKGIYRGNMVELDDSMLEACAEISVPYIDLNYFTLEWLANKNDLEKL